MYSFRYTLQSFLLHQVLVKKVKSNCGLKWNHDPSCESDRIQRWGSTRGAGWLIDVHVYLRWTQFLWMEKMLSFPQKKDPVAIFHTWLMTWKSLHHCGGQNCPNQMCFQEQPAQTRIESVVEEFVKHTLTNLFLFHTFDVGTLEVMTSSENNCMRNHRNLHNRGHHKSHRSSHTFLWMLMIGHHRQWAFFRHYHKLQCSKSQNFKQNRIQVEHDKEIYKISKIYVKYVHKYIDFNL